MPSLSSYSTLTTQGIIFYALPYQDEHLILHIFTEQAGLLKAFIQKGLKYKKQHLYAPFYELQWLFKPNKGELYYPKEATLIEQNLHLRKDFDCLKLASECCQAVKSLHPFGKKAPKNYRLLKFFLSKMNEIKYLPQLKACFLLKLLLSEGLLPQSKRCSSCSQENNLCLTPQGMQCAKHLSSSTLCFSQEDTQLLLALSQVQHFQALCTLPPLEANTLKQLQLFFETLAES